MKTAEASTFAVLGMHRSGTSALARSINILGPRIPARLMEANSYNASGYWEPQSIVQFNAKVTAHFDRHWADPKPFPDDWTTSRAFAKFAADAGEILEAELGHSGSAVVKDPRFSRVLPVWRDAFAARDASPVYLIACRNPMEVAQSLAGRDKLSIEHGLQLWLSYMLEAESATRGENRVIIHYEDLLDDWRSAMAPACRYAGLPDLNNARNDQRDAIDRFLAPDARHHVASRSALDADRTVPGLVKRAYELFLDAAKPGTEPAFDQLIAEWRASWADLSPGKSGSSYIDGMPELQMEKSKELESEGRIADALALASAAAETLGDRPQFHFRVGILSEKAGDLAGAARALRKALDLNDAPVGFYLVLMRVLQKLGDPEQESEVLRAALARHPDHPQINHRHGIYLEQAGDLAGAADAMRKALALDDAPPGYFLVLARVLRKLGDRAQEGEVMSAAVSRHPDHPQVNFQHGVLLERTGDLAGAADAMRKALALDDAPVGYHLSLARVLRRLVEYAEEAEVLRAAFVRHPDHPQVVQLLGTSLERNGDLAEAEETYATVAGTDRQILHRYADDAPMPTPATSGVRPASPRSLDDAQREALIRLLAWEASEHLATEVENLVAGVPIENSSDETWPMGRIPPKEVENPAIPPVASASRPVLSVLIPTYEVESEAWLVGCIDSVLAQAKGPEWAEIIIIDDSSEGTIARDVARRFAPRVRYLRNSRTLGLTGNFNRCILEASGRYVHILHQDDRIEAGFYDALLEPLNADDELVAAFSATAVTNEEGKVTSIFTIGQAEPGIPDNWLETTALRQRIPCPSIVVRRSAYEAIGGFSPSLVYSMDWDMWTRLAALGPVWNDPRPLACYRRHDGAETFRQDSLDRTIDCMHTVVRNSRLLPPARRHQIARLAIRQFLMNEGQVLSPQGGEAPSPEKKERTLSLLLRGQTNRAYVALAQSLLQDQGM